MQCFISESDPYVPDNKYQRFQESSLPRTVKEENCSAVLVGSLLASPVVLRRPHFREHKVSSLKRPPRVRRSMQRLSNLETAALILIVLAFITKAGKFAV